MDWLSNNIRCGDLHDPTGTNSGLIDGGGCLEIDPCWVGDRFNTSNPPLVVTDDMAQSIDTYGCNLAVNEDWLHDWAEGNIGKITTSGVCISVDNDNLFQGDIDINLDGSIQDMIDDSISKIPTPPTPPAAQDGK